MKLVALILSLFMKTTYIVQLKKGKCEGRFKMSKFSKQNELSKTLLTVKKVIREIDF